MAVDVSTYTVADVLAWEGIPDALRDAFREIVASEIERDIVAPIEADLKMAEKELANEIAFREREAARYESELYDLRIKGDALQCAATSARARALWRYARRFRMASPRTLPRGRTFTTATVSKRRTPSNQR